MTQPDPESMLDPAADCASPVVLFDFDGVLFRDNAFYALVRARFRRSWWRLPTLLILSPGLPLLLFPCGRRWLRHGAVRLAWFGVSERRYRRIADSFGRELARRPGSFLREGLSTLRGHAANGDRVLVVSACEETLLGSMLDEIGLGDVEVIASRVRNSLIGVRTVVLNFGAEKIRQIPLRGIEAPWAVAYSDSLSDAPMLRSAQDPVLVNATPKLCKALERTLGRPLRRVAWY